MYVCIYVCECAYACACACACVCVYLSIYICIWVLGYLGTWVPECLGTWVPECLGTWAPRYLGTLGKGTKRRRHHAAAMYSVAGRIPKNQEKTIEKQEKGVADQEINEIKVVAPFSFSCAS